MSYTRRNFFQAALAMPIGASLAQYEVLSASARDQVKITAIKAMQVKDPGTMIRIETDAGIVGYGPCRGSGPFVRDGLVGLVIEASATLASLAITSLILVN